MNVGLQYYFTGDACSAREGILYGGIKGILVVPGVVFLFCEMLALAMGPLAFHVMIHGMGYPCHSKMMQVYFVSISF
jgi:hypothetical protein